MRYLDMKPNLRRFTCKIDSCVFLTWPYWFLVLWKNNWKDAIRTRIGWKEGFVGKVRFASLRWSPASGSLSPCEGSDPRALFDCLHRVEFHTREDHSLHMTHDLVDRRSMHQDPRIDTCAQDMRATITLYHGIWKTTCRKLLRRLFFCIICDQTLSASLSIWRREPCIRLLENDSTAKPPAVRNSVSDLCPDSVKMWRRAWELSPEVPGSFNFREQSAMFRKVDWSVMVNYSSQWWKMNK